MENISVTSREIISSDREKMEEILFQFEKYVIKYKILDNLLNFLLLIQPTSVEGERKFSSYGMICSLMRSRLSDRVLDNVCFLYHISE